MPKTIVTHKSEITHYPDKMVVRCKTSGAGAPPMGQMQIHSPNPTLARKPDPTANPATTADALMRAGLRRQLGLDTIGQRNK